MSSPDVVIVGAGITGCAAAYNLAALGEKVQVIEKYSPASMASGWTLAGVRQSGRHKSEVPLAQFSVNLWPKLKEILGYETGYTTMGNLRLARNDNEVKIIQKLVKEQKKLGLGIEYLSCREEITPLVPGISQNVLSASFCKSDGHADPISTVSAFKKASENLAAKYSSNEEVKGIIVKKGRFQGVVTSKRIISSRICILANGININSLINPHNLFIPLEIPIVTVIQTEPTSISLNPVLGVANANLAMRKEINGRIRFTSGIQRWSGKLKEVENIPFASPSINSLSETISIADSVLPSLKSCHINKVWGGLIDLTPDSLPVIDKAPNIDGLIIAAGFSGHGFGIGPATGEILRDLAVGFKPSLPIEPFSMERFQNYKTSKSNKSKVGMHG